MNQLVRMSQIGEAEGVEEPSAELRVPFRPVRRLRVQVHHRGAERSGDLLRRARDDGKSWCAFHRRIVFEPARPSRVR